MALRSVIRRGPICILIEKLVSCLGSGAWAENSSGLILVKNDGASSEKSDWTKYGISV